MLRAGRRVLAVLGVLGVLAARHPMKSHAGGPPNASEISISKIPPLKWQPDIDCFRYLEIGRLGVSESSLKFSPNLQNSEPPSSESKGGLPHK